MAIKEQVRIVAPYASNSESIPAGATYQVQIAGIILPKNWLQSYSYLSLLISGGFVSSSGADLSFESGFCILTASSWQTSGHLVIPSVPSGLSAAAAGNSWRVYPYQVPLGLLVDADGWRDGISLTAYVVVRNGGAAPETLEWFAGALDAMWQLYDQQDFVPLG